MARSCFWLRSGHDEEVVGELRRLAARRGPRHLRPSCRAPPAPPSPPAGRSSRVEARAWRRSRPPRPAPGSGRSAPPAPAPAPRWRRCPGSVRARGSRPARPRRAASAPRLASPGRGTTATWHEAKIRAASFHPVISTKVSLPTIRQSDDGRFARKCVDRCRSYSSVRCGGARRPKPGRRGGREVARAVMAKRSRAEAMGPGRWGGWAAGTNRTRSSPSASRAFSAARRCPRWMGSKVPPMSPSFTRPRRSAGDPSLGQKAGERALQLEEPLARGRRDRHHAKAPAAPPSRRARAGDRAP